MSFKERLKLRTRWDNIINTRDAYRLLCSNPTCSLSCANLKNGRLLVTSVHGDERHSYKFTTTDMAFTTLMFLDSLSEDELTTFIHMFNKISNNFYLDNEKR